MEFCKVIIQYLQSNDNLPYLLKDDTAHTFIESNDCCIKHHVSFPLIEEKLYGNQYLSLDDFINDINLMWKNTKMFFGDDSEVARLANQIENDILMAWNSSVA